MGKKRRKLHAWLGPHLMIDGKWIDAIRSGAKRATVRLGRVQVRATEFYIHAGGRIIARAKLRRVVYKRVKELTDEDAKLDGLSSRDELISELKKYYGDVKDDDWVTIIEFDVVEHMEKSEERTYYGLDAYQVAELALKHLPLRPKERRVMEILVKYRSIRAAAKRVFGSISERWRVRKMLMKVARELHEMGIIKVEESSGEKSDEASQTKPSRDRGETGTCASGG